MRTLTAATLIALAAVPALAQAPPHHPTRHPRAAHRPASGPDGAGEAPVDRGPFTPEANRAYQGGGVILQGAPGAPAPMPEPTPPGQAPRNAVPVR